MDGPVGIMSRNIQMPKLRIGMLGCGSPARYAIVDPAHQLPEVVAYGVASRSPEHAKSFAAEYSIPKHYASYDELLADDDIDLVYIAVPTRVHGEWTKRALMRHKPVLCEKPLARNAQEAAEMFKVAEVARVPLFEGLHYRHHPVTRRVCALLGNGTIGRLISIDTGFEVPTAITPPTHSRRRFDHAGGAAIDPGCYCVSLLRLLSGEEPSAVSAEARLFAPNVDAAMTVSLEFPGGCTGTFVSSLDSASESVRYWLRVVGEKGSITVPSPYGPHADPVISICVDGVTRVEKLESTMTFFYQLRDVAAVLRTGHGDLADKTDSLHNMQVIDRIYLAAGLTPR